MKPTGSGCEAIGCSYTISVTSPRAIGGVQVPLAAGESVDVVMHASRTSGPSGAPVQLNAALLVDLTLLVELDSEARYLNADLSYINYNYSFFFNMSATMFFCHFFTFFRN